MKSVFGAVFTLLLSLTSPQAAYAANLSCSTSLETATAEETQSTLAPTTETVHWFGRDIEVTRYPKREYYAISQDLPALQNAMLVHFGPSGHNNIWYKGHRIDSTGSAGLDIRDYLKEGDVIYHGFAVAFHNIPPKVAEAFEARIAGFESQHSYTCTQAACKNLDAIIESELRVKNFIRPSSLLRFFVELPKAERDRLGIEFVSLGVEPQKWLRDVHLDEVGKGAGAVLLAGTGVGLMVSPFAMIGWMLLRAFAL